MSRLRTAAESHEVSLATNSHLDLIWESAEVSAAAFDAAGAMQNAAAVHEPKKCNVYANIRDLRLDPLESSRALPALRRQPS